MGIYRAPKPFSGSELYYTIYKTTNKINGKMYIGAHITVDPWDDYLGSGTAILKAVRKYGKESFCKEVLAVFDNADDMWSTEARIVSPDWVARKKTDCYNLKVGGTGGEGGNLLSVDTKNKIAAKIKGHTKSPETIEKHRQKMLGRKFSAEHRANLSRSKRKDWQNPIYRAGKIEAMTGMTRTEVSRERMAVAQRNRAINTTET